MQASEQAVAQLEEEKKHADFLASISKYDQDASVHSQVGEDGSVSESGKMDRKDDPVVDLFPDDGDENSSTLSL